MNIRASQAGPSNALVCLALAMAVLLVAGCSRGDSATGQAPQVVPVSVMEARFEQVPFALEAVGQAEGSREVEVRARVSGILVKRFYQEGSAVKAGQALFEIDKAPYEIALTQARGQLAEQKARVEQAAREAVRLKGLLNQRAISQKEYDDATSSHAVAEAGMQIADAAVHQAALNLSYATVTAPVGGIAGRAENSEGALINTGADSLLTSIVQANPLWIRFGVADADLAALRGATAKRRAISKVEALLQDGSIYTRPGRLNFESAEVDRQLGTMTLRAEFDNPDGTLIPGQFVRVRLQAGGRSAVLVPQTAVLQTDHGASVFVVGGDGTAQVRPLKTDGWSGPNWIVTSGLQPGDRVILDNLLKLKPGTPVKIDTPGGTSTSPAAAPAAKP
ncbi:MAG: efflux RND transporter periplasmic adaptor subunit [Georgfuchsia sp.]